VDLAYLRAHPENLPLLLTHQRIRETPMPGGSTCTASRLTLDDGSSVFAKTWPHRPGPPVPTGPAEPGLGGSHARSSPPAGFFTAEADGLRWLREPGAVPVPEVIVATPDLLALEWVEPAPATADAADRLGRDLAALHRAGAPAFGAPWPGFIGGLAQDNTEDAGPWPRWFRERRLEPYLRASADAGALSGADVALVTRVLTRIEEYGGAEPPARIHGDLWPGNLLWGAGRVWLVDPAAHGGHRETDLATLALFGGPPYLDRILAAYREVWPLAPGWQARVPVHQMHLMLVHTALFGSGYRSAVVASATAAARALPS
jgi:fructosamine-3-kinase